ncbi:hypothetical protein CQA01_15450 [Cyclobacterium qasimii]|nr:hypothetical protein CQA01_15450 [Cyclobacterium qasimii]
MLSCEEKGFEFKGQVFIVTQGGQNIPLGLISIGLMDYDLMNQEIQGSLSSFETDISNFENSIEDLKSKIESEYILKNSLWDDVLLEAKNISVSSFARKGSDYALIDAKPRYNQFQYFVKLDEESRDQLLEVNGVENLKNRYKLNSLVDYDLQRKNIIDLHSVYNQLNKELDDFKEGYSVLPPLEPKYLKTKTNSQGDFQLKLTKGKYFIFASGSRLVGSEKEKYMWAQTIEIDNDINDFFFSNDNLVSIANIRSLK